MKNIRTKAINGLLEPFRITTQQCCRENIQNLGLKLGLNALNKKHIIYSKVLGKFNAQMNRSHQNRIVL